MKKFSKLMLVGLMAPILVGGSVSGQFDEFDADMLKCARKTQGLWQLATLSFFGKAKYANFYGVPKPVVEKAVRTAAKKFHDSGKGLNLTGATLRNLNLSNVCFPSSTSLRGADLRKTNLSNSCLNCVDLSHACANNANFHKADMTEAKAEHASFRKADLSEVGLRASKLRGASFRMANLRKANLSSGWDKKGFMQPTDLRDAEMWNTKAQEANLAYANAKGAYLVGADFSEADLSHANFQKVVFDVPSFFAERWGLPTSLRKARVEGTLFSANSLRKAFHTSELRGNYYENDLVPVYDCPHSTSEKNTAQ